MKKTIVIMLALVVIISTIAPALADSSLQINGVNIPMIDSKGEELSIKEIDGIIYIPVEPFLKALGLDYTINDDTVCVTYSASTEANVDEYANLLPEEKYFVDLVLDKVTSFKNPSSITVKSLFYIGDESAEARIYIADISAQNGFGGYTSQYYMIMDDGNIALWLDSTAEKAAEILSKAEGLDQPDFEYGRINRAIQQKVSELGY